MKTIFTICIALCISFVVSACDESLPVRDDMSNLVVTSLSSGFTMQDHKMYLRFYLTAKNNSDETLEDYAAIHGKIQVTWLPKATEDPTINKVRTFTITASNIFRGSELFNTHTGKFRFAPKDSIVFYVTWDLKTDDSTYIGKYFQGSADVPCNKGIRRIFKREQFSVSANIKLYEQVALLYVQPFYTSQCVTFEVGGGTCLDLIFDPCSLIEQ